MRFVLTSILSLSMLNLMVLPVDSTEWWTCRVMWSSGGFTDGGGTTESAARANLEQNVANDRVHNNGFNTVVSNRCFRAASSQPRPNPAPQPRPNPPSQPRPAQQSRVSFITSVLSGRCIDVAGAPGQGNGAQLQLWDCELSGQNPVNGSRTDQRWTMTNDGFIRNTLSGKCIDVAGAPGRGNGAQLQLWDCELSGQNPVNGSRTDQRWTMTNDGFIRNTLSGKCIDVAGAPGVSNGARLLLWDCARSGSSNIDDQQWTFTD
jgi:hypothetical protein